MKQSLQLPTRRQQGITLVELVVSIVVITIAVAGVLLAFSTTLGRGPTARQMTLATQIAQERMELILAQRRRAGFLNYTDPCPASTVCAPIDAAYTPATVINGAWAADGNINRYRVITVTVTGPGGLQLARLTTLVANY